MAKQTAAGKGSRVTATVTREQNRQLQQLAARHKVSVGWLVRHAIDRLLEHGGTVELPFKDERK